MNGSSIGITDVAIRRLGGSTPPVGADWVYSGTYVGTGAAGNAITGVGFQPDVLIIRSFSGASISALCDRINLGTSNYLNMGTTALPVFDANSITAFGPDGFTVGNAAIMNTLATVYGFIALKVKSARFGVNNYAGSGVAGTIPHALGATPNFYHVKSTAGGLGSFRLYNDELASPATVAATFANTVPSVSSGYWNDTSPDGVNINLGTGSEVNSGAADYLLHSLAEAAGEFKMGTYTGNGNAAGPAIAGLGFKPQSIIIFRTAVDNDSRVAIRRVAGVDSCAVGVLGNSATALIAAALTTDADGFTLTTGNAAVNSNTAVYTYLAFAN